MSYIIEEDIREYWNDLLEAMRGVRQDTVDDNNVRVIIKEGNRICPVCKSEFVKMEGKHGEFMGCSYFPECRYVYK